EYSSHRDREARSAPEGVPGAVRPARPRGAGTSAPRRPWPGSAPFALPAVIEHGTHAGDGEQLHAAGIAIRATVEDMSDTRIDHQLGAHHARTVGHEHHLVADRARRPDRGGGLGMDAAALPRDGRIVAGWGAT